MTGIAWPAELRPSSFAFRPSNISRSGGRAINGGEQTVGSQAGRWLASGTFPIRNDAQVRAGRALLVTAEGPAYPVLVPSFDGRRANWPRGIVFRRLMSPGFTRRRRLDGTLYADPKIPPQSEIHAKAVGSKLHRAVEMSINVIQGSELVPGQYFGVREFLYLIKEAGASEGSTQTVKFWPPLREAVGHNTVIELARPVCRMKLVSDDEVMGELAGLRFTDLTLQFREDV